MSILDRMYMGRMGSWSINNIGLLIATDVRFFFLLRGADLPPDAAAADDEDA
jgi:hypothetical protein